MQPKGYLCSSKDKKAKRYLTEFLVVRSLLSVGRAVRCSIAPCLNCQEISVKISLMGQIQALLADVEVFVLGAVNGGQVELDRHSLLIYQAQGTLHLVHLASALLPLTVIRVSSPSGAEPVLNAERVQHPAHQNVF